MNRIKYLIANNSLTFAQAKIQAQEEVLAIFGYSRSGVAESELLDITQSGVGNAKLLSISAILQGNRSVGELSELLANISTDITNDGVINDNWLREKIFKLENYSGGIEELSIKISNIRTWTYISNQTKWIKEYEFWQNKTKEIEDNLSDNLLVILLVPLLSRIAS